MTTTIKRNIMKEAHKLAKKMVGDYQARLALALSKVWQQVKNNKEENKMTKITFTPEQGKLGFHRGSFEVDTNDEELKEILSYVEYSDLTHIFSLEKPFSEFKKILERKNEEVTVETSREQLKKMLTKIRFGEDLWGEIKSRIKAEKTKEKRRKKAAETGEEQFYYSYRENCNDSREQCDIDLVNVYIKPNGETREERIHTY